MQAELQLPHLCSIQDVGNLAARTTAGVGGRERRHAVSTAALVVGVAQRNMVEDVVRIHAELELESLRKLEVLHDGRLGGIVTRAPQVVKARIADRPGGRSEPYSTHKNRSEVLDIRSSTTRGVDQAAGSQMEAATSVVRPADPGGVARTAIQSTRKRQAAPQLLVKLICQPPMTSFQPPLT